MIAIFFIYIRYYTGIYIKYKVSIFNPNVILLTSLISLIDKEKHNFKVFLHTPYWKLEIINYMEILTGIWFLYLNSPNVLLWASLVALMVRSLPAMRETQVQFLSWEDPWRRKWQPTSVSCLENSIDGGAWWAIIHGVAKLVSTEQLILGTEIC